ncbi:MAG: patatin-like phospholipase family protein [Paludibacteraceae bacterium]|nr:patatin-like phospholipase family protein [Paludibacteraceae bacterium]
METKKDVALVLASGGSRGLAHIGAIEVLLQRGYNITSIAGCSMGSLIAGIYACGKLEEAREWFLSIDRKRIFELTDVSLSINSLVKGQRVIEAIKEFVPDRKIEDLPIPLSLVASDVVHNKEVVMESGSLFDAIRASISIPMFFEPVEKDGMLLIDGGVLNALPLNRVRRKDGDLLVAMNISAPDVLEPEGYERPQLPKFMDGIEFINKYIERKEEEGRKVQLSYTSLLSRMTDMMIQNNTVMMLRMCRPDILAEMPMNAYPTMAFDKAEEIIEQGRVLMSAAVDKYESSFTA